ncbi:MAG: hydrogenase, partial [Planctomycetia bacterium]|nr:hydrogenase [Planctomycetia bacterium]
MSDSIKISKEFIDKPLIAGNPSFHNITEKVSSISEGKTKREWFLAFGIALSVLFLLIGVVSYLVWEGIGIWGLNNPVAWGWAIVNFVFWVGIGHAGTLISAILLLFRQKWRTSINRFAEAM